MYVCEGERERYRETLDIYVGVCETGYVCVPVRDRVGMYVCVWVVLLNPSVILAHLGVRW